MFIKSLPTKNLKPSVVYGRFFVPTNIKKIMGNHLEKEPEKPETKEVDIKWIDPDSVVSKTKAKKARRRKSTKKLVPMGSLLTTSPPSPPPVFPAPPVDENQGPKTPPITKEDAIFMG